MTATKQSLPLLKLRSLILTGLLCSTSLVFAQQQPIASNPAEAALKLVPMTVISMPARPSVSRVWQADRYEDLHKRIDKLNDKLKAADCTQAYFLHKAQAWHNISREYYHEGSCGGASDAAYNEAALIVKALEEGKTPSMETKLIEGADKLRLDLWGKADSVKSKFSSTPASCCAAKEVAYCEVSLVRAGYAQANLGGKARTQPLIGMATDVCEAAAQKQCVQAQKPVVVLPTAPTATAVTSVPVVVPVTDATAVPKLRPKVDRN